MSHSRAPLDQVGGLDRNKGVLLVPGNRFDLPGYARLGYCTDEKTLREGLSALSQFLREYNK